MLQRRATELLSHEFLTITLQLALFDKALEINGGEIRWFASECQS